MIVAAALSIAQWLLGFAEKRSSDGVRQFEIQTGLKVEEVKAKTEQLKDAQATIRALAGEGTERQKAKMNWPVFWVIITAALGPGVLMMWAVAIYNIFFWRNGLFPQSWEIAAFPPQSAAWVNMSIEWLFDPVGASSTVGTATAAGWITGRR